MVRRWMFRCLLRGPGQLVRISAIKQNRASYRYRVLVKVVEPQQQGGRETRTPTSRKPQLQTSTWSIRMKWTSFLHSNSIKKINPTIKYKMILPMKRTRISKGTKITRMCRQRPLREIRRITSPTKNMQLSTRIHFHQLIDTLDR